MALKEKGIASKIIGVDSDAGHCKKAIELGLVDEVKDLKEAITVSDLVLLAIPVDALIEILPKVMDNINFSMKAETVRFAASGTARSWKMRRELCSKAYTTSWKDLPELH